MQQRAHGRKLYISTHEEVDTVLHFHVDDVEDSKIHYTTSLQEAEVDDNDEIEDHEDIEEELLEIESMENEDNLQLEELQLIIPIEITEEEQQELRKDKEDSDLYIEIFEGESP